MVGYTRSTQLTVAPQETPHVHCSGRMSIDSLHFGTTASMTMFTEHDQIQRFVLRNIHSCPDFSSISTTQRKAHISKSILFIHWTILNIIRRSWFVIWPLIIEEEYINKYQSKEIRRRGWRTITRDAPWVQISHLQRNYICIDQSFLIQFQHVIR